ncbi:DUF4333 domain-containing protein [Lentzea sp. NPDC059081]|uniref:DUF4333 domain-containing protein n=1 Tax=Lentzea sp. NPDC059081 TaxID=3346719 RepID=UPI0036CCAC2E
MPGVLTTACTVSISGIGVTTTVTVTATPQAPEAHRVFVAAAVERDVVQVLRDEYKISDVGLASCPLGQAVDPGSSFFCTVGVGGRTKSVKIMVKSVDGEYEVGQPE